jgi:hypothetical protein
MEYAMKNRLTTARLATMLLAVTTAYAVPTLDQSQYDFNTGIPFEFRDPGAGFFLPNYPVGQSFTAGLTGLLTNIQVGSNGPASPPDGTMTMEVRSGDGVAGTLLGAVTVSYLLPSPFDSLHTMWILDVDVTSLGINVAAASQYTFLFTSVTGGDLIDRGILAQESNPYAGGRAYSGPGYGDAVAPWDLQFKTFVDQGSAGGSVPESGSVLLLTAGALGLLTGFRRKQ